MPFVFAFAPPLTRQVYIYRGVLQRLLTLAAFTLVAVTMASDLVNVA